MATSKFFRFADMGSTFLNDDEYEADPQRRIGNQPGMAREKLMNKLARQCSALVYLLADYIQGCMPGAEFNDATTAADFTKGIDLLFDYNRGRINKPVSYYSGPAEPIRLGVLDCGKLISVGQKVGSKTDDPEVILPRTDSSLVYPGTIYYLTGTETNPDNKIKISALNASDKFVLRGKVVNSLFMKPADTIAIVSQPDMNHWYVMPIDYSYTP